MTDELESIPDAPLARYLSGEASPSEVVAMELRLANDPATRRRVEAMRSVWTQAERLGPSVDVDRMWVKVRPAAPVPDGRARPGQANRRRFARFTARRIGLAAAVALAVGAGVWATRAIGHGDSPAEPPPMREVVTTTGQRAEIRLGDGSRVILGVESRLRFPVTLGSGARDLELFGQAYFEVRHDPKRPFRVRAGGVVTEDLGTEFVVRSYAGDSAVRVAVIAGEVSIRREGDDPTVPVTTLVRGDFATLGGQGPAAVTHNADLGSYLGWTTGRIEFRRTELTEVARELSRWYGVEVRLGTPEVERLRLTANFRNESIEEVLHLITASLSLRAERVGDVVTLRRK